jgi:hypothetical protein
VYDGVEVVVGMKGGKKRRTRMTRKGKKGPRCGWRAREYLISKSRRQRARNESYGMS